MRSWSRDLLDDSLAARRMVGFGKQDRRIPCVSAELAHSNPQALGAREVPVADSLNAFLDTRLDRTRRSVSDSSDRSATKTPYGNFSLVLNSPVH